MSAQSTPVAANPLSPDISHPLVRAELLNKRYTHRGREGGGAHALIDVSLTIARGESLALIGESGSGKSTLGRALLGLETVDSGTASFDGVDIASLSASALRALRRRMQIVFQEAGASLDPRLTVGSAVREGITIHEIAEGSAADIRVHQLFDEVGLRAELAERFPHELSAGQRQRIAIARALSVDPEFVVLDEPISALDVSVQAQVLVLLQRLQRERGLTCLFITHDLTAVRHLATRTAVMYLGRIVEEGPVEAVTRRPAHPCTVALRSAVPSERRRDSRRILLRGNPPSSAVPPDGCAFHPHCPHPDVDAECRTVVPLLLEKSPGHRAACPKNPIPLT